MRIRTKSQRDARAALLSGELHDAGQIIVPSLSIATMGASQTGGGACVPAARETFRYCTAQRGRCPIQDAKLFADFERTHRQVVEGIHACLSAKLITPTLILIYSEIDIFAWIAAPKTEKNTRTRFESWVRNWLLSRRSLGCSPTDLYAARCGVLHSLSFDSDLARGGHARRVMYAWGDADADELRAELRVHGKPYCVVHTNELFGALCEGISAFLERAETDPMIRDRVNESARSQMACLDSVPER